MSGEQHLRPDPANEISEPIRTGAEPFYVLVISDDGGERWAGGKPIVWEHHVPTQTSLFDVMQKQARLGERYGASYVAECRILPGLTRDPASNQTAEHEAPPEPKQASELGKMATSPQSAFSRIFMRLFGQRRNG